MKMALCGMLKPPKLGVAAARLLKWQAAMAAPSWGCCMMHVHVLQVRAALNDTLDHRFVAWMGLVDNVHCGLTTACRTKPAAWCLEIDRLQE